MGSIRQKLIDKIKAETELTFEINSQTPFYRPTLTWQHKTVGRLAWYWLVEGMSVGSSETMTALLKSPKLVIYQPVWGIYEVSSS